VDDEFFFPQNVQTTYRLFGLGPKHLRRAAMGLPAALAIAALLGRGHALWGVLVGTILAAAYVGGACWPANGDETVLDLWLHVRRMQRQQTIFNKREATDAGSIRTHSLGAPVWNLRKFFEEMDRARLADEPAPEERP
jgi:hypothetical protein